MIIEFSVGNFRSFRNQYTLSLAATPLKSAPGDEELDQGNIFEAAFSGSEAPLRLLTGAAIYGANASGKSNVAAALNFMREFVLNSSKESQAHEQIEVEPFRLSTASENAPSFFEIIFLKRDQRFRYGFEVSARRVVREWLFGFKKQEVTWFTRDEAGIQVNARNFPEGMARREFTRPNVLFLSLVASLNGEMASEILTWFRRLTIVSGLNDREYRHVTESLMEDEKHRAEIVRFVRQLDVGISDVSLEKETLAASPPIFAREPQFRTVHPKFDETGSRVGQEEFKLEEHESDGTRKLVFLSGVLLRALRQGRTLVIDEMDARLHPIMTRDIIRLFGSRQTNPRGAQLIFATHDTNLLGHHLLRRDQIWFTEKDDSQASHLVALAEYRFEDGRIVRNDASLENDYIQGKFGAIPFLGDLKRVVGEVVAASDNGDDWAETPNGSRELAHA